MSIATEITRLATAKSNIKTAIENKGVQVPSSTKLDAYPQYISQIEGGGGGDEEWKDVNFIDYDGTLLYSYTSQEFLALSAMPANPTHSSLTAQGWSYSFANAQAYVRKYGKLVVGQYYITSDGKTRIYITIPDGDTHLDMTICISGIIKAAVVDFDWGDGVTESNTNATSYTVTHTYQTAGSYVIAISSTESFDLGSAGSYNSLCGYYYNSADIYRMIGYVTKIEFGSNCLKITGPCTSTNTSEIVFPKILTAPDGCRLNRDISESYKIKGLVIPQNYTAKDENFIGIESLAFPDNLTTLGNSCFVNCYSLKHMTIPEGVTSVGNSAFQYCYSLSELIIPEGVTSIGSYCFNNLKTLKEVTVPSGITSLLDETFRFCTHLEEVTLPNTLQSIGGSCFRECYVLRSINIPEGVTSIGNNCFQGSHFLPEITIPSTVTTIGTNAFQGCWSLMTIRMLPTTPPTIQSNTFNGVPADAMIIVPAGCGETYKTTTNWSARAAYIVEAE